MSAPTHNHPFMNGRHSTPTSPTILRLASPCLSGSRGCVCPMTKKKTMLGSVAVANLAFQKSVICRFTLDYWKTTSEVAAEYSNEIRPGETPLGCDRFTFSIKLADTANLESKTLFFCIRYTVKGQEFWDNNSSTNFQVDFRKKHLPQNGKSFFQGDLGNRRNGNSNVPLPKSTPVTCDESGDDSESKYDQPIPECLGDSASTGLRLKSKSISNLNLASDGIAKGLASPSGPAFANRYDLGASLSAAVQAAKDSMSQDKDGLYMKANVRSAKSTPAVTTNDSTASGPSQAVPGTSSPTPSLPNASYEELVNKYCFVRTHLRDGCVAAVSPGP